MTHQPTPVPSSQPGKEGEREINRISFSGGLTSGYMLRREMEAHPKTFDRDYGVDFCNTGREHEKTLDFVHAVETNWGIEINWLEYDRAAAGHAFKVVNYETAARRGQRGPFDVLLDWAGSLPSTAGRSCSGQLKVRTMRRYLQSIGLKEWKSYIGIRADEGHRTLEIMAACPKYITPIFPLYSEGIRLKTITDFWEANPFTLEIMPHEGNCDLCFLKKNWKRETIMRKEPWTADWWIEWEGKMKARGVTGNGARWKENHSYKDMLKFALHPEFPNMKIDETEEESACTCVVAGYREDEAK